MAKKILFVGAGAIGSYIGSFLSRAGHDVTLVDPWAEQVETIRKKGLSLDGVTPEDILGVLRAVAPQVGLPKVVAAAPEIMVALGLDLDSEG